MSDLESLKSLGYYAVDCSLPDANPTDLTTLKEWIANDQPKHTGWAPFWWPIREAIAPKIVDQRTYQCTHDGSGPSGQVERWRATIDGEFTIIRAHDMDRIDEPGKWMSLVLPVWRISEILLHSARMAEQFDSSSIDFSIRFTGLKGRELTAKDTPERILTRNYTAQAPECRKRMIIEAADVNTTVAEYTDKLLREFYQLFQFTLPANLCEQEIEKLRSNRF